jgi:hypothetical protein
LPDDSLAVLYSEVLQEIAGSSARCYRHRGTSGRPGNRTPAWFLQEMREIEFMVDLPKTASGKILRLKLLSR